MDNVTNQKINEIDLCDNVSQGREINITINGEKVETGAVEVLYGVTQILVGYDKIEVITHND